VRCCLTGAAERAKRNRIASISANDVWLYPAVWRGSSAAEALNGGSAIPMRCTNRQRARVCGLRRISYAAIGRELNRLGVQGLHLEPCWSGSRVPIDFERVPACCGSDIRQQLKWGIARTPGLLIRTILYKGSGSVVER
jgi:hypothetical protein